MKRLKKINIRTVFSKTIFLGSFIASLLGGFFLVLALIACSPVKKNQEPAPATDKATEKTSDQILKTRQAPEKIEESFTVARPPQTQQQGHQQTPQQNAPSKVSANSPAPVEMPKDMAQVTAPLKNENHLVHIKKSALGKAFLLTTSLKTSGVSARWEDFQPVLVSFERSGGKIGMFELVPKIYDEISPERLISTFEIKSETESEIVFDLQFGFRSIPQQEHYENPVEQPEDLIVSERGEGKGLTIKDSFIKNVQVEANTLIIEQASRIQIQESEIRKIRTSTGQLPDQIQTVPIIRSKETAVIANLQIRPYVINKDFKPLEHHPDRKVGFFTIRRYEKAQGDPISTVMRWDTRPEAGPIRVLIAKDVPASMLAAVEEGVQYWNRILNKNTLVIERGIDTSKPSADRTITIRWLPWHDAGFAYASMQADPLTGEVLRAQVFMTSFFAKLAEQKLSTQHYSQPNSRHHSQHQGHHTRIGLSGFKTLDLCNMPSPAASTQDSPVGREIPDPFPWLKSPELKNMAAQDYVRSVIAHEMGHVMGLRHNFAGTNSAGVLHSQIEAANQKYMINPAFTGLPAATTVMDYPGSESELLIGRFIKSGTLKYDQAALNWSQNNQEPDQVQDVCSDEELMLAGIAKVEVLGCKARDNGSNPIASAWEELENRSLSVVGYYYKEFLKKAFPRQTTNTASNVGSVVAGAASAMATNIDAATAENNFQKALDEFKKTSFMVSSSEIENFQKFFTDDGVKSSVVSMAEMKKVFWKAPYIDWVSPSIQATPFTVKDELKGYFDQIGGLSELMRRAVFLDSKLQPDKQMLFKFVESITIREVMPGGKTTDGVHYQLSQSQLEQIHAAITEIIMKDQGRLLSERLSAFKPAKGKKIGGFISAEDQSKALQAVSAVLLFSAQSKEIKKDQQSLQVKIPLLDIYTSNNALEFFKDQTWTSLPVSANVKEDLVRELKNRIKPAVELLSGTDSEEISFYRKVIGEAMLNGKITYEVKLALEAYISWIEALQPPVVAPSNPYGAAMGLGGYGGYGLPAGGGYGAAPSPGKDSDQKPVGAQRASD